MQICSGYEPVVYNFCLNKNEAAIFTGNFNNLVSFINNFLESI